MLRLVALSLLLASLLSTAAGARWRDDWEHRQNDVLLSRLHDQNRIAMDLCWIMVKRATSPDGRRLAQQTFDDRAAQDRRIVDFASAHHIDARVVTPPSDLRIDFDAAADRLTSASGDTLDREFASVMVDLHKETLQMLEEARPRVSDGLTLELVDHQIALVRAELVLAERLKRQEQQERR